MRRIRFHPLIAWLVLIGFGVTNTLLAGGIVICRDGHGKLQVEWGCDRSATGECISSCGTEIANESSPAPHPCQDSPIQGEEQITGARPRLIGEVSIAAPLPAAALTLWTGMPGLDRPNWIRSDPERPPDALRHIRTVVLIV